MKILNKLLNKEYLLEEYVNKKLTMRDISKNIGCNSSLIYYYLKKYNIMTRSEGWKSKKKIIIAKKWLLDKYIRDNLSSIQIAKLLKCDKSVILNYLHEYNIPLRNNPTAGVHSSNYIDGRSLKKCFCIDCGKEIRKRTSERCRGCWGKWEQGENNPAYIDGQSKSPYPPEFNDELKLKIRQRDNYICQNCGMTEEEHIIVYGKILHVHHIDYNKLNCIDTNLITTCISCNSRANFNRYYWQEFYTNKLCIVN